MEETKFIDACNQLKCKPVLIHLPNGDNQRQMMTSSPDYGTLPNVQIRSFQLASKFIQLGFQVSRVKIEYLASNIGAPITDLDSLLLSNRNYFEFHLRLLFNNNNNDNENNQQQKEEHFNRLKLILKKHDAHLSRNAFRKDQDFEHRFITLRMYRVGRVTALERLENCKLDLSILSESIPNFFTLNNNIHKEYSVYDSNVELDSGWID
eukprot:gene11099-13578_t